jgi:hypothetical protein
MVRSKHEMLRRKKNFMYEDGVSSDAIVQLAKQIGFNVEPSEVIGFDPECDFHCGNYVVRGNKKLASIAMGAAYSLLFNMCLRD